MGCLASAVPEVPIIGDRRSITRENCTEPSKSEAQVLALQAERRPESWVARAAEGGPAGALPCFRGQWEGGLASQPHTPTRRAARPHPVHCPGAEPWPRRREGPGCRRQLSVGREDAPGLPARLNAPGKGPPREGKAHAGDRVGEGDLSSAREDRRWSQATTRRPLSTPLPVEAPLPPPNEGKA